MLIFFKIFLCSYRVTHSTSCCLSSIVSMILNPVVEAPDSWDSRFFNNIFMAAHYVTGINFSITYGALEMKLFEMWE